MPANPNVETAFRLVPPVRLTIGVPYVRGIEYAKRTLESILRQPAGGWCVLVVDNSSDEKEGELLRQLLRGLNSESIRYERNLLHLSASDNFNRILELSETDLVSTVHSDDEVKPFYAAQVLELADRNADAAAIFVQAEIIDANSHPMFSLPDAFKKVLRPPGNGDIRLSGESALRSIMRGNWIFAPSVCFRRTLLGDLRWDATYPQTTDLDLWARIFLTGRLMVGSRMPTSYRYRRHRSQTTAVLTHNLERFYEESKMFDLIADRATVVGWHSVTRVARSKAIISAHLSYLLALDLLSGRYKRARAKLACLRSLYYRDGGK